MDREGGEVTSGVDDDEEDDGAPWNSFLTSNLGFATGVEDAVFDNEAAAGLPLTGWAEVGVAGTVPNDFTPSVLMGGTEAGDEDIGAETSSIEPKVTAEPGFTVLVGLLAAPTPSL